MSMFNINYISIIEKVGNYLVLLAVLMIALGFPVLGGIIGLCSNICFFSFGWSTGYSGFTISSILLSIFNMLCIINWGYYQGKILN